MCNHISFMDPLVIMGCVRRPVRFVMYHRDLRDAGPEVRVPRRQGDSDRRRKGRRRRSCRRAFADGRQGTGRRQHRRASFPKAASRATARSTRFRPGVERILAQRPVPVRAARPARLWGSLFSRARLGARSHAPAAPVLVAKIELVAGTGSRRRPKQTPHCSRAKSAANCASDAA